MSCKVLTGAVLLALVIAHGMASRPFGEAAAAQAPAKSGVPTFQLDPSWPKWPDRWTKFGDVASVAVDAQDNVWVTTRPDHGWTATEKAVAAPPVLEFDAAGNFIQGWGGPGDGYEWPEREHGIHVDYKGYVWIGGMNFPGRELPGIKHVSDDQLLKFTKSGKLVMQIGHSNQSTGNSDTKNLKQPADAFVYQKTNEVFVADGYDNHRVIVYDADSGAFKRMWGAFGKKPPDTPPRNSVPPPPLVPDDGTTGPPQFDIVHAIRVSSDGLVYVADREYKRIQVFTIDGKFVTQTFIRRNQTSEARTATSLALSPDSQQKFLYVGGGTDPQIVILNRKTLEVLGSVGRKEGFGGAHHMAVDSKGNIYAAETRARGLKKFVFKGLSAPSQ